MSAREGDSAAPIHYTAARLTPIAAMLRSEIERSAVTFILNYDGAVEQPQLLPARRYFDAAVVGID